MNEFAKILHQTTFILSAPTIRQLPPDEGCEVAFVGRSNVGKSSALNILTQQKNLAKTSKTPGRTQLINVFSLGEGKRLIDLPGYGFAKVPEKIKQQWQLSLSEYLQYRASLKGLMVLMDARHPFTELDENMLDWAIAANMPIHILFTKVDKLNNQEKRKLTNLAKSRLATLHDDLASFQLFSASKAIGLDACFAKLEQWYQKFPL